MIGIIEAGVWLVAIATSLVADDASDLRGTIHFDRFGSIRDGSLTPLGNPPIFNGAPLKST